MSTAMWPRGEDGPAAGAPGRPESDGPGSPGRARSRRCVCAPWKPSGPAVGVLGRGRCRSHDGGGRHAVSEGELRGPLPSSDPRFSRSRGRPVGITGLWDARTHVHTCTRTHTLAHTHTHTRAHTRGPGSSRAGRGPGNPPEASWRKARGPQPTPGTQQRRRRLPRLGRPLPESSAGAKAALRLSRRTYSVCSAGPGPEWPERRGPREAGCVRGFRAIAGLGFGVEGTHRV